MGNAESEVIRGISHFHMCLGMLYAVIPYTTAFQPTNIGECLGLIYEIRYQIGFQEWAYFSYTVTVVRCDY